MGIQVETVGGRSDMALLWANPGTTLPAKIVLPKAVEFIYVETAGNVYSGRASDYNQMQMIHVVDGRNVFLSGLANAHSLQYRVMQFSVSDDGITITFGTTNVGNNSTQLIPMAIYG